MPIPPPEHRIAFARQPEGHPVALYTQGVDRKATHDIPTDGAPSPAPASACRCRRCSAGARRVLSLLLVLVLLAGPLLTKDWCVSHAERLEVLGLDGEWLQVRTKDGLVGLVKRTNVVYRGGRGGGGGRGGRGGGRGGVCIQDHT